MYACRLEPVMKQIVYIASYPKSGNTWARSVLANAIFNEGDIGKLSQLIPSLPALNQALHQKKTELNSLGELMEAYDKTQLQIAAHSKNNRLIVKTHNACGTINGFEFPNETRTLAVVYLIRDPRDVLISWAAHMDKTLEETERLMFDVNFCIAKEGQPLHREFVSSWENHVIGWQNFSVRPLVIRYEDMVSQTRTSITKICNHLQLDVSSNVDNVLAKTSFEALKRQEFSGGFAEQSGREMFFRSGKVGSWKSYDYDFSKIEQKFEKTMRDFRYF